MTLEQQFRNGLAGQLSDEKSEVEIKVASKVAREFAIKFGKWISNQPRFSDEESLKIYEDEVYGK